MPNSCAEYILQKMMETLEPTELVADDDLFEVGMATESTLRKTEFKPFVIPARFRENGNLIDEAFNADAYQEVASQMLGPQEALFKHVEAARRLIDGPPMSLDSVYRSLRYHEDDLEAAALSAYRIEVTDAHRQAIRAVIDGGLISKQEPQLEVTTFVVQPASRDAIEMANAIQRAANAGQINPVKLNGKHSKGSMIAQDPKDRRLYLLKPGYGKNSPAAGVSEDASTQSEREAGFYHVARTFGIEEFFPKADLLLINGHQTAAMELLPVNYRNLGEKKKMDPNIAPHILAPYLSSGVIFKWALMDFILGNPDRHSQNIMIDPENRKVVLIDHGSAFAGRGFDPAGDENSFIPFYLRAWTGLKFTTLNPKERLQRMPTLNPHAEQVFEEWVKNIDEHRLAAILAQYHINPEPVLERLARIKMMPGPKWLVLNKLWAGGV